MGSEDYTPVIDTGNLILPTAGAGTLIPNNRYFTTNPTHGDNFDGGIYGNGNSGTCGSVAAQLLLGYNNYYNDRRIIEDRYLNGYNDSTNSVTDTERNPKYCEDPTSMTRWTTGTRSEATGDNSFYSKVVRTIMEPNTSGATVAEVHDGIKTILNDRIHSCDYKLNYEATLGLNPISSSPIKTEIDAGRPLIISLSANLGGNNHQVVGYGYQDYTYPNGGNTYPGYVVHFGWHGDTSVWINSTWCKGYISLQMNHTHNYLKVGAIGNTNRIEYRCNSCGYRTDQAPDNVYLDITNVGKIGNSWQIRIENLLNTPVTVYYNSKMCFLDDAKNWTGLTDINSVTLSGRSSKTVTITENGNATSIALSYINYGVRNITYADQLATDGSIHNKYEKNNLQSYSRNGMKVSIVGKNGGSWLIILTNNTGDGRWFYYNSKMCYAGDAQNWTGLSDEASIYLAKGATTDDPLSISENASATSIAISYKVDFERYIFYAYDLNTSGTMSAFGNLKPQSYTQNGIKVCIVGKEGNTWNIQVTNNTGSMRDFYYNTKMCYAGDAEKWTGLSDPGYIIDLPNGVPQQIKITENFSATSIAISYMDGNYRKIFYAYDLNATTGTMSAFASTVDTSAPPPAECVAEGTLITLADGSQKAVEDLTGDELLLVWNMETGTFDTAPILFIDSDPIGHYEVIELTFSDDTTVDVIYEHGFWDFDLNRYVYLDENAEEYIGHRFNKQTVNADGSYGWTEVTLTGVEISEEVTTAYSPVTYGHLCYYVNGMLSMPGGVTGLMNIFDVDTATLTIDQCAYAADIAEYGLFTYEEFYEMFPISKEVFDAFNGQYLKVSVGKGLITYEQIGKLIERYTEFF